MDNCECKQKNCNKCDIKSLKEQLNTMEIYLALKLAQKDWHGVADAAMDIRELEAQIKILMRLV